MSEALNDAITSSSRRRRSKTFSPSVPSTSFKIPNETRMGPPTLRVKDLDKMLSFYEGKLGLHVDSKVKSSGLEIVELGVTNEGKPYPLLILKQDPSAKEPPDNFAGLFHFAVLVPDRKSLAHAFLSLERSKVEFEGFADHLVSESLYLHDPEINGIEIYRDRPFSEWKHDSEGQVMMDTLPLDLAGILGELPAERNPQTQLAFPNGARIGHMHLRVTNLERSLKFYNELLGFHISADWSTFGAMFLSAGNYHHHIGLNTWHSLDGKRHSSDEAGLDSFTIQVPKGSASYVQSLELNLKEQGSEAQVLSDNNSLLVSDPDGIPIKISMNQG
jgi:catechol 2,3-dioxygenase